MAAMQTSTPSPTCVRLRTRMRWHSGTNSGYFSMSATRSNMSDAAWRTRRVVRNEGIACFAGGAQAPEIVAGVVRGAGERARRHHRKALGVGDGRKSLELVGRHEPRHRVMLARRLQVLPDGEEVDVGRAQI